MEFDAEFVVKAALRRSPAVPDCLFYTLDRIRLLPEGHRSYQGKAKACPAIAA